MMKNTSGFSIQRSCQRRGTKFYNLPVVLCTAYDTFKEDMKSIAADYYVIKSFDLSELKSKIAMALEANVSSE